MTQPPTGSYPLPAHGTGAGTGAGTEVARVVAVATPYAPPEWIRAHGCAPWPLIPLSLADPPSAAPAGLCPYAHALTETWRAIRDRDASAPGGGSSGEPTAKEVGAAGAVGATGATGKTAEGLAGAPVGLILATTCDPLRRLGDHPRWPVDESVFWLNVPATHGTPAARVLYETELRRLGRFLVARGGTPPTAEGLGAIVAAYDQARHELEMARPRLAFPRLRAARRHLWTTGRCPPMPPIIPDAPLVPDAGGEAGRGAGRGVGEDRGGSRGDRRIAGALAQVQTEAAAEAEAKAESETEAGAGAGAGAEAETTAGNRAAPGSGAATGMRVALLGGPMSQRAESALAAALAAWRARVVLDATLWGERSLPPREADLGTAETYAPPIAPENSKPIPPDPTSPAPATAPAGTAVPAVPAAPADPADSEGAGLVADGASLAEYMGVAKFAALTELAGRYAALPDPARRPNRPFYEWLGRMLAARGVERVLVLTQTWCDPWRGEIGRIRAWSPVPVLALDAEEAATQAPRVATKLEAFLT